MTAKIDHPNHMAKINFKFDYDTKGAIRYVELNDKGQPVKTDAEGALIGTLYLRKAKLNGKMPKGFTIDMDEQV